MPAPLSASPPAVCGPDPRRARRTAGTRPITRLLEALLRDRGPARWP